MSDGYDDDYSGSQSDWGTNDDDATFDGDQSDSNYQRDWGLSDDRATFTGNPFENQVGYENTFDSGVPRPVIGSETPGELGYIPGINTSAFDPVYGTSGGAPQDDYIVRALNAIKRLYGRITKDDLAKLGLTAATVGDILSRRRRQNAMNVSSGKWTADPSLVATRTQLAQASTPFTGQATMGRQSFAPTTYAPRTAAQGGVMGLAAGGLRDGAFIIPADVVSHFGNGSSEAGLAFLSKKLGATPIKGKGDGMSDSINTTIEGRQRAKVANEEAMVSPEKVAALGKGNPKQGAKVLYAMMDRVRQARTGTKKQGKQIKPEKFAPGGIAGYANGGAVAFRLGGGITGNIDPASQTAVGSASNDLLNTEGGQAGSGATTTGTGAATTVAPINTGIAAWATPYVEDYVSKGFALANAPYEAYTGTLSAGYSDLQKDAFEGYKDWAMPASYGAATSMLSGAASKLGGLKYAPTAFTNQYSAPAGYQATQFTNQYTSPEAYQSALFNTGLGEVKSVQDYMNPYLQNVTDIEAREARRQSAITGLSQQAKMAQAGALGGSRDAIMRAELARNLGTQIGDIQSKGLQSAYDRALAQRLEESKASLESQRLGELSRQYGYTQGMSAAELQAKFGLSAQEATELSKQFKFKGEQEAAAKRAEYALAAQKAQEESKQFGATYGLDALKAQAAAAQGMGTLAGEEARYGLAGLKAQLEAGNTQRTIEQEGLDAAKAQFDEEQGYDLKMQQYKQSLLKGLPIEAGPGVAPPSLTTEMIQGITGLIEAYPAMKEYYEGMYGKIFG